MSKKKFNFSESFSRLEEIVEKLEGDATDLDAGLKLYEEGLGLVKECQKRLGEVENKVTVLKEQFDDAE